MFLRNHFHQNGTNGWTDGIKTSSPFWQHMSTYRNKYCKMRKRNQILKRCKMRNCLQGMLKSDKTFDLIFLHHLLYEHLCASLCSVSWKHFLCSSVISAAFLDFVDFPHFGACFLKAVHVLSNWWFIYVLPILMCFILILSALSSKRHRENYFLQNIM